MFPNKQRLLGGLKKLIRERLMKTVNDEVNRRSAPGQWSPAHSSPPPTHDGQCSERDFDFVWLHREDDLK